MQSRISPTFLRTQQRRADRTIAIEFERLKYIYTSLNRERIWKFGELKNTNYMISVEPF